MNNFKEEAEIRFPNESWTQYHRNTFISGCDFGYQQGIEEGMRFAEWLSKSLYDFHTKHNIWAGNAKRYTTAELFEIFKKEQL